MAHAHGRKGSGGHGKLAGVEQQGRASVQGVEELLTVQPRQSQALQVARTEVRGALRLDHEGREGVFAGADASSLRVLWQRVSGVLPVPALSFVLLKVPNAEYGVVLLLCAWPVPDAILTPGAVRGHGFRSGAVGAGAQLIVMLQFLFAVSARFVFCKNQRGVSSSARSTLPDKSAV